MTQKTTQANKRPLSPHLQIYRPQLTSILSILHRITGVSLIFGTVIILWGLLSAAAGAAEFTQFQSTISDCWILKIMLIGWLWALNFHLFNGVRHLFWDAGIGLEIKDAYKSGYAVIALSILATIFVWCGTYH